jgi:cytochrome P450
MVEVMVKHAHTVAKVLDEAADSGATIDLQDLFFKYTLTTFAEIGFGEDINEIEGSSPFGHNFDEAQHNLFARGFDPFWKLKRRFQIGDREKTITKSVAFLNKFTRASIAEKRKNVQRRDVDGDRNAKDLLSRWIIKGEEEGINVDDTYLVDVMMNFLIAGRDTTACALSWTTLNLMKRPDVEAKVLAEVADICGDQTPSYETAAYMKFLDATLHETIRLNPPVPSNSKFTKAADVLPDGTRIPANTVVAYRPYIFGRSKKLWGEDALEFDPERWLKGETITPFKFISFNAGRRVCLGKFVAILEMKILLGMILPKFKLKMKEGHPDVTYMPDLILKMKDGLHVNVQRR